MKGQRNFSDISTCSMRVSLPTPQIKSPHEDLIRCLSVGPHCMFLLRMWCQAANICRSEEKQATGRRSWFADLGKKFRCICGKLTFSLVYLRTGLVNKSAVLGEK